MYFRFWGTRGSIPVPGSTTIKYGGNTPCIELRTEKNNLIILDAGSGLREFGKVLAKTGKDKKIDIFVSHYHWDHIQGIPFFLPLYKEGNEITFYGETSDGKRVEQILSDQMAFNYFPIKIGEMSAHTAFKEINPDCTYKLDNLKIETFRANHSSPTISFKITEGNRCLVYMTDNELKLKDSGHNTAADILELNRDMVNFVSGCDYLIHDSMYDESSVITKKGWGHSCNVTLAYFSILAKVKNIILFHYNPDFTDAKIDEQLKDTLAVFMKEKSSINCIASHEGLSINF